MITYDDPDAIALRQYRYAQQDLARAQYRAMTPEAQRAYAFAHPDFRADVGNVAPPQYILIQIREALAAGDHELARSIDRDWTMAQNRALAQAAIASDAMPFGERVIMAMAWLFGGGILTCVAAATGYVAAGPHGAAVWATPIALITGLIALRRLASSIRD